MSANSTSISLLRRLREPEPDAAWTRFVDLYAPLIFHWGKSNGLAAADAADLVQEVMAVLVVKLPEFEYDPDQSFRAWLKTVALNKARDLHRRNTARPHTDTEGISGLAVAAEVDLFGEEEHRRYLVARTLRLLKVDFQETTWSACWRHVVEGASAREAAEEFGLTLNAFYIAKSRIIKRLREELEGLLEE